MFSQYSLTERIESGPKTQECLSDFSLKGLKLILLEKLFSMKV